MATKRYPTRLQMPFPLLCGMVFSAFMTGLGGLGYVGAVIGSIQDPTFQLNGQTVTAGVFWAAAWPFILGYPVGIATLGAVAYALWKERPWFREAIMAFWAGTGLFTILSAVLTPSPASNLPGTVIALLVMVGGAAIYLYSSPTVRQYHEAVCDKAAGATPAAGAPVEA